MEGLERTYKILYDVLPGNGTLLTAQHLNNNKREREKKELNKCNNICSPAIGSPYKWWPKEGKKKLLLH